MSVHLYHLLILILILTLDLRRSTWVQKNTMPKVVDAYKIVQKQTRHLEEVYVGVCYRGVHLMPLSTNAVKHYLH